ncbi:hypothetical protein GR268_46445, partial [Rhizobium leguminosarum]|nr:hypothetical protein [Rhizobium leguminosarum]
VSCRAQRSDDGFEVIEKANLAALEDIKASLARLNSRGIDTSSSAFPVVPVEPVEPVEPAIYVAATSTSDVISSGYAQVTPKLPRKNAKKKRRRRQDDDDDEEGGGEAEDEWTVLEQPRRPTPAATSTAAPASKTGKDSEETGDDGY